MVAIVVFECSNGVWWLGEVWLWWSWRFEGDAAWERKGKKEILGILGYTKQKMGLLSNCHEQ